MEKLKVLSLFSGIGAFEKALEREKIPHEVVAYCEIDKYASKSYSTIHNIPESLNLGDISKVDTSDISECDLVTYGFPCQDISIAGLQKGIKAGETRSGLLYEALRIIEAKKPKYAIAENVKNLVGKRFKDDFEQLLALLDDMGYNSYWQVLNAKDYGIPQNRNRVFVISIRKDIDNNTFTFPEKFPLNLRLRDMLENEVEEKFYLSQKMIDCVLSTGTKNFYYKPEIDLEIARPLTASRAKMHRASTDNYVSENFVKNGIKYDIPQVQQIGNCRPTKTRKNPNQGRIYDVQGLSPCLNCMTGGNREPHIVVKQPDNLRIRKLTPKECWRLMGFDDTDIEQCINIGISNTQLYKQAGNSIVVNVLQCIFRQLF